MMWKKNSFKGIVNTPSIAYYVIGCRLLFSAVQGWTLLNKTLFRAILITPGEQKYAATKRNKFS
jgi:hypothetical protein